MRGKGGRVNTPRQPQPCLTSLLIERRKDWLQIQCGQAEEKQGGRDGGKEQGNAKRPPQKENTGVKEMHKELKHAVFVKGSWWEQWENRQTSVTSVAEQQCFLSLPLSVSLSPSVPAWTELWYDLGEWVWGVWFGFAALCCRSGFDRAVMSDWTQCATWRLLRWLLPSLQPPALFGLWSWLRTGASPRCTTPTVWEGKGNKQQHGSKADEMVGRGIFTLLLFQHYTAAAWSLLFFIDNECMQPRWKYIGHQACIQNTLDLRVDFNYSQYNLFDHKYRTF